MQEDYHKFNSMKPKFNFEVTSTHPSTQVINFTYYINKKETSQVYIIDLKWIDRWK